MLFTIIDKNFEYIPIQYNIAWTDEQKNYYDVVVKQEFIEVLEEYCSDCRIIYIWDFYNMTFVVDRGFQRIFKEIIERKCNIILANVVTGSALSNIMQDDFKQYEGKKLFQQGLNETFFIGQGGLGDFSRDIVKNIHSNYLNKLITGKCQNLGNQYLVSSGVYSNMQIELKNLFVEVSDFRYIVYLLWKNVCNDQFDAIIATSKNGVAFASILGEIIGRQVLYYNIGQMFEETYNSSPVVDKGKRYLHIYDMICLGSEAKVLYALISAQGGYLYKSMGIVCLPDLKIISQKNRYSSLNHVECLLGQQDLDVDYKIYLKNPEENNK